MRKSLCVLLAVMLSITVIPSVSENAKAASSGWELDSVAQVSGNFVIDMALDNDGNPYIGYISNDGFLKCAHYKSNLDTWETTIVSADPIGYYRNWAWSNIALDVDSSGNPHILFFEWNDALSGSDLVYASYDQSNGWSKEVIVTADNSPGADDSEYVSLAIGNDDMARVVYSDKYNGYLCYAERTISGWAIEYARAFPNFFLSVLVLDSDNRPHIGSYYQNNGKFVLTTKDGATWSTQTITTYYVNDFTPMVMDHANKLHISFHAYSSSYSSMGLRYQREGESAWTTDELLYNGDIGITTSIAVDSSNNPHITCPDRSTNELKYFWNTAGEWANSTIVTIPEDNEVVWDCIELDQYDVPSVAYVEEDYGTGNYYLKFAKAIAIIPPSAPTNFEAVPGDGRVDLTWGAVANNGGSAVLGYNIFRGTVPGNASLLLSISNGATLSYADTGLTNGVTYYYQISAYNSAGEGVRTSEISATPSEAPSEPSAPTNFQAVPGNGKVDLSWGAVEDDGGSPVSSYRIYRGTSSGGETLLTTIGSGSTFSYSNTGLENGVKYYYQISALNAIGEGPRSNEIDATPIGLPGAPVDLVAHRGDSEAKLVWKAPYNDGGSPIVNYTIYRSTTSNSEVKLVTIGVATSYNDSSVINGQRYYYKVTATNSIGEGPRSGETSTVPSDNMTPVIALGYDAGMPGNLIPISGTGFDSNTPCTLHIGTSQVQWSVVTGPYGEFTSTFEVPNIANGTYLVKVEDQSGFVAYENLTIGKPVIFLGTDNGSPGVEVSISGHGFRGDSHLTLHIGTLQALWSEDTDIAGAFNSTFVIPDLPSGEYDVVVSDLQGNLGSAVLEIGIPMIFLGYDSGCPDAVIPISGSGFEPESHLSLFIGGVKQELFDALTDANGSFSSSFKVPDMANGEYFLNVSDLDYHLAVAYFTIGAPHISLGSDEGSPGVEVPIQGYGFHPGSALSLYVGTFHVLWSAIADDAGAFNTTFKVPDLASGDYLVNVTDHEGYSAYAGFELRKPSIIIGIPTGYPGAIIPISGTGFAPNSPLNLRFGSTDLLWSVTANSIGAFNSTFTVPQAVDGTYLVNVTDTKYHLASATFTVGEPIINIGDISGAPGSDIEISGQGFAPNSQLSLYIGSQLIPWSVQTDASGCFSSTFKVPDMPPGSYILEIRDASGHNATGELEVLSPEEPDDGSGRLIYAGIGAILLVGAGAAVMLYHRRRIK